MRSIRFILGGAVVIFVTTLSGVTEIRDALEMGASPRNGIETLIVAAIFATLYAVVMMGEANRRKLRDRLLLRRR